MQITNELKERLKNAKTDDERNEILASAIESAKQAGIELDDAELDEVAGGGFWDELFGIKPKKYPYICKGCGRGYNGRPSDGFCIYCACDVVPN